MCRRGAGTGASDSSSRQPLVAPETGGGARRRPQAGRFSGEIKNRSDVIRAIDQICEYYRSAEPGNPVPLLLRRAQRLVDKDFMTLIEDLIPESVSQLANITGKKREAADNPPGSLSELACQDEKRPQPISAAGGWARGVSVDCGFDCLIVPIRHFFAAILWAKSKNISNTQNIRRTADTDPIPSWREVGMTMALIAAVLAAVALIGHRKHNTVLQLQGDANRMLTEAAAFKVESSNTFCPLPSQERPDGGAGARHHFHQAIPDRPLRNGGAAATPR